MKRKALLIGNTRGLNCTAKDISDVKAFLTSYYGGAWNPEEIEVSLDKSKQDLLDMIDDIRKSNCDYVFLYFSGHGGVIDDTIIEINPTNELISEVALFGVAERQLNILDCCRGVAAPPTPINEGLKKHKSFVDVKRDEVRMEYENLIMSASPQFNKLYSCSRNESSYGTYQGSYYTQNLLYFANNLLKSDNPVRLYKCHNNASKKTTADVMIFEGQNQHPEIIPAKCLAPCELPISFTPTCLL